MEIEIRVPELGESITEATVSAWLKSVGESVADGEILVELETDKVMVEVPAAGPGVITTILKGEGEKANVGETLCKIETDGKAGKTVAAASAPKTAPAAPSPELSPPAPPAPVVAKQTGTAEQAGAVNTTLSPAVRKMIEEHGLDSTAITGTGKRGQITKGDVIAYMEKSPPVQEKSPVAPQIALPSDKAVSGEREERVRMTRLRQRIAERLLHAQQTAAILTTFNEVDMSAVMALRSKYKESFKEKYGVAVGFMSFFTKACIEALKNFPAVNAEIDGDDIIYKNYYDIGVAVGTEKGLVVPIVRNADQMRFIEIELAIAALAKKARDGKLELSDLTGGTFTISNGGIYGSMLSTPIINPPQSGILGMHNITKRAVVVGDEIVVRPMMYVALSYDHRIIDGREAVQFLIKIKQGIEDPARMMLEI